MNFDSSIYIAGHRGMVGSAIWRALESKGYNNLVGRTSRELDLIIQKDVNDFFKKERPEYVFLAAAKVGGIHANNVYRADFLYDNLMIQSNMIKAAADHGVKKLMFLGSSCIYPKMAPQPLQESSLLSGFLEPTNEPYAIAKIAGIKMCENFREQYGKDFISVMPTNLYGIGDNYHPENSHVLPALIRKFHEAKEQGKSDVEVWGSGAPRREFLFSDDLAEACIFLMERYSDKGFINIGTGSDITIKELALKIKEIIGFDGELKWDHSKPDGTPRKLMDVSKLTELGWTYSTELDAGIRMAYQDFLKENIEA